VSEHATAPGREVDPKVLDEVVRRIVEVADPDRIILFGSAARGEMTPDSDIDLIVVKSDVEHRGRMAERIYRNLWGIRVPVDVIVYTAEDIERFRDKVGTIVKPALREGREIYAR
jgi:predicted nucleotidyltransferase